jgi:cytoskeletal protein CcmA (bactofilin family)
MFRQKKNQALTPEKFVTILGPLVEVTGDIRVRGSIRIDGRLHGNVDSAPEDAVTVVVGTQGQVEGHISARRVVVVGRVQGSLLAAEEVELHPGSVVHGDIACASLSIAHGAQVLGRMTATRESGLSQPEAASAGIKPAKRVELVA